MGTMESDLTPYPNHQSVNLSSNHSPHQGNQADKDNQVKVTTTKDNLKFYYLGIDAHQNQHVGLLTNPYEQPLDQFQITSDLSGVQQLLDWLQVKHQEFDFTPNQLIIGVEGGNRYKDLLVNQLLIHGYQVYEVNPVLTQSRRRHRLSPDKTDQIDAGLIVEVLSRQRYLLSTFTLSAYQDQSLNLLHLIRFWEDLTVTISRLKNQIHRLNFEIKTAPSQSVKKTLKMILEIKLKHLKHLQTHKQKLRILLTQTLPISPAKHLIAIKGISTILALRLMAHVKDINRFKNLNAFIKYAGLAPTSWSSGQKHRYRQSKTGNRKLNSVIYLIALNQIRWNPVSKAYYEKKLKEGKTKRQAIRCLAKRIATIIYGVLKSQKPYQPPSTLN